MQSRCGVFYFDEMCYNDTKGKKQIDKGECYRWQVFILHMEQ